MLEKIVEFFKSIRKSKKVKGTEAVSANDSLFLEKIPETKEGYDKESNTIVCLVSNKKPKQPYQVKGIEDVASKNNWKAWLYLGPVLVLIAVFLLYPLINTIFMAFCYDYQLGEGPIADPSGNILTFNNFAIIFGAMPGLGGGIEHNFTQYAVINTIVLVFVTVPISIILALIISVALNSIKWFQKFLQTVFFLPYVTNAIAVGMVFSVIFSDTGLINFIFNIPKDSPFYHWVTLQPNQWIAMIPLILYIVWNSIPFKILIFLSGLQGIDKQYYQAAQIDSCSKVKVLTKITIPLLSPQILYIMVTSFIGAFKEYTSVVGLFGVEASSYAGVSNMQTIVFYVYKQLNSHPAQAAAAAVFLFVIILIFTAIQFAVSKKRVHY